MMEFEGEFTTDYSREELWSYFTDPNILAQCAPGVSDITLVSESELTTTMSVGVGSVKPTFDVDMIVTEIRKPEFLQMKVGGEGSRNSFEAVAEMTLVDHNGTTTAQWTATASVSGLIASMGQRALNSVSHRLVNNFFEEVEAAVADESITATEQLKANQDIEASID
ncbi:MAG: CoxG family protein [Halobacteriaceae archaeon]